MELSKEFIEQQGLNEDQVSAIKSVFNDSLAETKNSLEQEFSSKANENAEGILGGALKALENSYGFKYERPAGEKIADSVGNAMSQVFESKKAELEEKLKKASGADAEALKAEYEAEKDALLQKFADYEELKEKSAQVDDLTGKYSSMKQEVAWSKVKPSFHDDVNKYEADYKWSEFKKKFDEKYTLEFDDDMNPMYVDKENKYKTGKLEDLVSKDEGLQTLTKGRQQSGTGARQVEMSKVEGVPFDVPSGAGVEEVSKQIKEYLGKQGLTPASVGYSDKFKEYFNKIRQKTAA